MKVTLETKINEHQPGEITQLWIDQEQNIYLLGITIPQLLNYLQGNGWMVTRAIVVPLDKGALVSYYSAREIKLL